MAEWWKSFTDAFGSKDPAAKPASLRDRLEQEKVRLRETEKQRRMGDHRRPGESEDQAMKQDAKALATLLGWKLDVRVEDLDVNPARIDGYWFGVKRYVVESETPDDPNRPYDISYKLFLYRPCSHCRFLIPTIELGDYSEIVEAAKRMTRGEDPGVGKSTAAMAKYLAETEGDRLDPYLPRFCPKCRKLIKGCKDE